MPIRLRVLGTSLMPVVLGALCTALAHAQISSETEALRKELDALKEGQATIRKELEELKNLLRARQAPRPSEPQNLVLAVDGAPSMGDNNATLTLIEFSDLQCPFCARHVRETLPQIERDYIKTGKLKYVLRDFPIDSIHPQASKGHEAARCAGEQGTYWEMHARLLDNQKSFGPNDLTNQCSSAGIGRPQLSAMLGQWKASGGSANGRRRRKQSRGQRDAQLFPGTHRAGRFEGQSRT